jgi:hypothetical protein
MSRFHGKHWKGAMRHVRALKRMQAIERNRETLPEKRRAARRTA